MQYSPKLKKAMEEIAAVIKKHDIAGVVVLHTPNYSEHRMFLQPSYSCVSEFSDNHIRVKAKAAEYDSIEARNAAIRDTTNMFHHLANLGGKQTLMLMDVADMVNAKVKAEHDSRSGYTSHQTQNN